MLKIKEKKLSLAQEHALESQHSATHSTPFSMFCHAVLIVCSLAAILPFMLLVSSSFSDEGALLRYGYSFFPRQFTTAAYDFLFQTNLRNILNAYRISVTITVVGLSIHMLIAPALGYAVSRKDYPRRKIVLFFVLFTMLFNGGLVPQYIMWTQLWGIGNTIYALILPNLITNGFMIMLYMNNFRSNIHPALIEAAKIDGAGELYIYRKIALPLSLPILATVGLMVGVNYWNDWMNGLYYINDPNLFSLQVFLNTILNNVQALLSLADAGVGGELAVAAADMPTTAIRMAIAVVGVIPILVLYPFFQKYFIRGISLGGVKE